MVKKEKAIIINVILTGQTKKRFLEIKQKTDITKPNTKILESCINATHKILVG